MDDQKPTPPVPTTPEVGEMKPVVPDAHAGEPMPAPEEGLRPEADPSVVRPEQDEPNGPLAGLMTTAVAEAEAEATDDPDAEALLASMGVEDEGIEGGQLLGIMAATIVSIAALCIAMYFLFFSPALDKTRGLSETKVRYEELEVVQNEGRTKLTQYALSSDSAYTLPIEAAMGAVAAQYADAGGIATPRTRAEFNTVALPISASPQNVAAPDTSARTPLFDVAVPSGERVGVDAPDPTRDTE